MNNQEPKTVRDILLYLVNECEECAMRGERIMCQTAPKEEMRLKCIDQSISDIERIIVLEETVCPMHFGKYHSECKECIRTFSRNQAIEDMKARIKGY